MTRIAPTNAAARIINGTTCHHFITKYANSNHPFKGIILIDEISMLCLPIVAILDQMRVCCRIIAFGDFDQLEPVSNCWRGQAVDPKILKESHLLKRWSDSTMFQLTRCRRSDQSHFNFYTSLPDDIHEAIRLTKQTYRKRSEADLHLVISHNHRRNLNDKYQKILSSGKNSIKIAINDGYYDLVVGTPLIGTNTTRKFINGAFYECLSIHPIQIKDTLTDEIIECTQELLSKHTTLAHSVVYNKAQGLTIKNKVIALYDLYSMHFRRQHLYVGLSRVTNGGDIRIR